MTTGRKCQVCGLQLKADDTFCGACRTTFCPRCKRAVDADGGLFCAVCGASLKATRKTESQKRAEERAKNWRAGKYEDAFEPSEFIPIDEDDARYWAWAQIANFQGRGSGIGFWLFLGAAWGSYCYFAERGLAGLGVVAALISLIPAPASAVRRLHDVGLSGYWLALALIPVVGWAVLAVMLFLPGQKEPNRYGFPTRRWQRKVYQDADGEDRYDARLINDGKVYDGRFGWRSVNAVDEEDVNRR